MRPGAIFLNLSRGFVVDQDALRDNILSGHLAGAAIDVFPVEPKAQGDAFESKLRGLPNVILTPHVGGSTEEAQQDIGRFVSAKLRDYVFAGSTALSVNLPPGLAGRPAGRPPAGPPAHQHPGVLATVNNLLAEHGVNIEGQVLVTRDQLGYALTDVSADYAPDVVQALARPARDGAPPRPVLTAGPPSRTTSGPSSASSTCSPTRA